MIQTRKEVLLNAVTATTTSRGVGVDNAGRLSLLLKASGITSGNGVFTVEVTNDPDLGWVTYNRLTSNVTNTNAQTDTRVGSVTLSSNSTAIVFFPPGDTFAHIRVKVTVTTDGTYSAVAYLN
jgi:hypothetical protein